MRLHTLALGLVAALAATTASAADWSPKSLQMGRQVNGTLVAADRPSDNGGRSHDYRINLPAGQLVAISAKSDDFDTVLVLFGPTGNKISENDDREGEGDSTDSLIVTEVEAAGEYLLRVHALSGDEDSATGDYTLKAMSIADQ